MHEVCHSNWAVGVEIDNDDVDAFALVYLSLEV